MHLAQCAVHNTHGVHCSALLDRQLRTALPAPPLHPLQVALGQPPNENMVGTWGTWRRGTCVDDSFNPEHRGYGYRLYDSVLHGLPLSVETGTPLP